MLTNEKIHNVFLAFPLPVLLLEPREGRFIIVDANSSYLEQVPATLDDLIEKEMFKVFPKNLNTDSDVQLIRDSLKEVVAKRQRSKIEKLRYRIPIGGSGEVEERIWNIENIPVFSASGEVELIINIARDITEEELKLQREQQVSDFLEENLDALFSLDREGRFTSANRKILTALEMTLDELLGTSFGPLCAPEDLPEVQACFHKTLSGVATKFETGCFSSKGARMQLQVALMPLIINNRTEGVYGFAKDITGLRQTEKVVLEKKKFLEVNAAFITALIDKELNYDLLEHAFSFIGKAITADRIGYFEAHPASDQDEMLFSKKAGWNSNPEVPGGDSFPLQNMRLSKVKETVGDLFENRPFIARLSELPEGILKEVFEKNQIQSLLLLPIFVQQRIHGFISFVDGHHEKYWTEEDVIFLEGLAKNLTYALEKRRAEERVREKEEQLRENEKRFRALVQEGSDVIAILDAEGNYKFISATAYSVLGIVPEEILGENAFQFIHPDDRQKLIEQFESLKKKKQIKVSPFRYTDRDGNWIWLETTATNLLDDPAIKGIITNSRNVTTLLEQAREIEHINERYRLAARATQDIIYDWDLARDRVERFHSGPTKLFGFTEKQVRTRRFWRTHIHPADFPKVRAEMNAAIADPERSFIHTEYRFQRADGSYAPVLDKGYILRDTTGKAIRLIGATSDISEIKTKEEALKIANERFKFAMDATNEMIYDWDLSTNEMIRSQAFETIYGYSLEEKHPPNSFWFSRTIDKDRERVEKSLKQAIADKDQHLWREEYAVRRADDSVAHVIDRASLLRDGNGKLVRMVGAVLDITQSLQLLNEVQRQNQILREIAWEQSHVVRAPLARLKGLIYLLELQGFEQMEQQKILEHITSSADELDEIVKGIVARTEELD